MVRYSMAISDQLPGFASFIMDIIKDEDIIEVNWLLELQMDEGRRKGRVVKKRLGGKHD